MCREYKLVCLSWCVSCYPILMVNLIWFADDKFFKFYSCNTKKHTKQLHLCVCGDSLIFACLSKTAHSTQSLRNCWVSGSRDTRFQPPCCLVLTQWTFFSSANETEFAIKVKWQLTAPVETSKLVLTTNQLRFGWPNKNMFGVKLNSLYTKALKKQIY